jgi:hypothetical protein
MEKPKISLVFSHMPRGTITWPSIDYDYKGRIKEITEEFKKKCPEIEFILAEVQNIEGAKELVKRKNEFDGFVVYLIGMWTGAPKLIARSSKPVILIDDLYGGSGEFLFTYGPARREGFPVVGIASQRFEDVVSAVKLFKVIKEFRKSRVLVITPNGKSRYQSYPAYWGEILNTKLGKIKDLQAQVKRIKELFGIDVIGMSYEELEGYCRSISDQEAESIANELAHRALKIIEPSRKEIFNAARMYLALKSAAKEKEADALTIDCCLGNKLCAFPCVALAKLNNEGFPALCEADMSSLLVQLLMHYLSKELCGRSLPGFLNDPVIDLSLNQIIYAHCSAPTKMLGQQENLYILRSLAERRTGVAVQSLMPLGKVLTGVQLHFMGNPTLVIHQAKTIENIDREEGCRTKLAAETNAEKILLNWNKKGRYMMPAQWHRVVFYGDWRKPLIDLATLMGIEVFEEDRG